MAKNHKYESMSAWFGGNQLTLKNQVLRVRCVVEFTCTHDGDAVSTDHRAVFDIEMPAHEALEVALKQHVVKFQNGLLRAMTATEGAKFCRDNVLTKDILYPGARKARVIVREPTLEEMKAALIREFGSIEEAKKALED